MTKHRPTIKLPEYIIHCGVCEGEGQYIQTYTVGCGGGDYRSMGTCEWCLPPESNKCLPGPGYVYAEDQKPIPRSVVEQIRNMNNGRLHPSDEEKVNENG